VLYQRHKPRHCALPELLRPQRPIWRLPRAHVRCVAAVGGIERNPGDEGEIVGRRSEGKEERHNRKQQRGISQRAAPADEGD
jgi:hypothetical protein